MASRLILVCVSELENSRSTLATEVSLGRSMLSHIIIVLGRTLDGHFLWVGNEVVRGSISR